MIIIMKIKKSVLDKVLLTHIWALNGCLLLLLFNGKTHIVYFPVPTLQTSAPGAKCLRKYILVSKFYMFINPFKTEVSLIFVY